MRRGRRSGPAPCSCSGSSSSTPERSSGRTSCCRPPRQRPRVSADDCCSGCWSSSAARATSSTTARGMSAAAARAVRHAADETDPEQAMLAAYLAGAAHVFAGRPEEGAPAGGPGTRAAGVRTRRCGTTPGTCRWRCSARAGCWTRSTPSAGCRSCEIGWRRIQTAREQGALGLARRRASRWRPVAWRGWATTWRRTPSPARRSSCWRCWAIASTAWPTRRWPWSPPPVGSTRRPPRSSPGRRTSRGPPACPTGRRIWPTR